jgi:hypothetical protein
MEQPGEPAGVVPKPNVQEPPEHRPATHWLFGVYEPAGTGLIDEVGLRWRGLRVDQPTIIDPTTGARVTVEEAVCRTPRHATEEPCSGSPESCWRLGAKAIGPCHRCLEFGVVLDRGLCKFCFEEHDAPTFQPWLALTAASMS